MKPRAQKYNAERAVQHEQLKQGALAVAVEIGKLAKAADIGCAAMLSDGVRTKTTPFVLIDGWLLISTDLETVLRGIPTKPHKVLMYRITTEKTMPSNNRMEQDTTELIEFGETQSASAAAVIALKAYTAHRIDNAAEGLYPPTPEAEEEN